MGVSEMTAKFHTKHGDDEEKKKVFMELVDGARTTPRQGKFPAQNQASHCWNRYNEWVLCLKTTDGNKDKCSMMRQYAMSICPDDWTGKWDEEREEGSFPGIKYDG
jgi:cytochrome c oxidase subunit 6b